MVIPSNIARGIVRLGSLISSAGMVEISNPAYAQNIRTSADPKLLKPNGENGEKWVETVAMFEARYSRPMATKKTSGASLRIVRKSLVLPAALTPNTFVIIKNITNSALTIV